MTLRRFEGRVAVVLGGGADGPSREHGEIPMGNGRAIAMRLASEGARVVVVDRRLDLAKLTVDNMQGEGHGVEADLSKIDDCTRIVETSLDHYGRIDAVIANAAVSSSMSALQQTVEDWEFSNDVNVRGHWLVAQKALPQMIERGAGSFVFVGSTAGQLSSGRSLAYEATKAAQLAVMRHIAVRFGSKGIRSNAVVLGVIDSALVRREFGDSPDALAARSEIGPMRRQGRPEEVAGAAAFLASDDASYINGHSLIVDGGVSAQWPSPRKG